MKDEEIHYLEKLYGKKLKKRNVEWVVPNDSEFQHYFDKNSKGVALCGKKYRLPGVIRGIGKKCIFCEEGFKTLYKKTRW